MRSKEGLFALLFLVLFAPACHQNYLPKFNDAPYDSFEPMPIKERAPMMRQDGDAISPYKIDAVHAQVYREYADMGGMPISPDLPRRFAAESLAHHIPEDQMRGLSQRDKEKMAEVILMKIAVKEKNPALLANRFEVAMFRAMEEASGHKVIGATDVVSLRNAMRDFRAKMYWDPEAKRRAMKGFLREMAPKKNLPPELRKDEEYDALLDIFVMEMESKNPWSIPSPPLP